MLKYIMPLIALLVSCAAYANTTLPMDEFGKLPILHDGRIKPLDSFARIELLRFSKKDKTENQTATEWLAETLFDPGSAPDQKIFLVANANTRHLLGLEERKKPLYSFAELSAGLEKTTKMVSDLMSVPPQQQTVDQKDILSIHENALEYTLILRSFSSLLPLNIQLPPSWQKKANLTEGQAVTYTALKKIEPDLQSAIRTIIKHKGQDPSRYTPDEQATAMLGWQLQTLDNAGEGNTLFRAIPLYQNTEWASPWELINDGKANIRTGKLVTKWTDIAKAWQSQDNKAWEVAVNNLSTVYEYDAPPAYSYGRLATETDYNRIAPFTTSIFIFAGAMVLACLNLAGQNRLVYRLGFITLGAALFLQGAGLATRIYLMERPPVGTLYESLLFVGFVAPLVAFLMELRFKNGIGLLCAGISGALIGLLALSMAGEGDNMKMLGAVLNTRFWLTTHVLCITIGYGWCLVTSVLAHLLLIGQATHKLTATMHAQLLKTIKTLALFSLLFTTVGTILGGIWADQSWGRFWGWDPKENGALLIVLWLIWLIHGKIAAQISERVWTGGMAFLSVIVAAAWIGVNLLGVGLHSYGFIEGVFWSLGAFTLLEMMTIGGLIYYLDRKDKLSHAA